MELFLFAWFYNQIPPHNSFLLFTSKFELEHQLSVIPMLIFFSMHDWCQSNASHITVSFYLQVFIYRKCNAMQMNCSSNCILCIHRMWNCYICLKLINYIPHHCWIERNILCHSISNGPSIKYFHKMAFQSHSISCLDQEVLIGRAAIDECSSLSKLYWYYGFLWFIMNLKEIYNVIPYQLFLQLRKSIIYILFKVADGTNTFFDSLL